MRSNRKYLTLALAPLLLLVVSGCGGLQASRSVSPATFLVPGLMQAEPQKQVPADPTLPALQSAAEVVRL